MELLADQQFLDAVKFKFENGNVFVASSSAASLILPSLGLPQTIVIVNSEFYLFSFFFFGQNL